MRVQLQYDSLSSRFSEQLLDIGNGRIPLYKNTQYVHLRENFCNIVATKDELIKSIFLDLRHNYTNHAWLRDVADAVGVARSVVARLWNRFQETGNVRRRPGAGRPRSTTSTDDRYIQLTARRNRTENATQLQRQLLLATGRRVSSQAVRNRLHMREGSMHVDQWSAFR
ncbi:ATP-dependent DNA helicase [Trichonephila clavipes]|nr:ATP-dependent DNA helicase [Trichonephila clavipes]